MTGYVIAVTHSGNSFYISPILSYPDSDRYSHCHLVGYRLGIFILILILLPGVGNDKEKEEDEDKEEVEAG